MNGGMGLSLVCFSGGQVGHNTGIHVHFHLVAFLYFPGRLRALNDRQAGVKGIAVEYPGERIRHDHRYPGMFDGDRRMLPRRTAAEIFPSHNHIAGL